MTPSSALAPGLCCLAFADRVVGRASCVSSSRSVGSGLDWTFQPLNDFTDSYCLSISSSKCLTSSGPPSRLSPLVLSSSISLLDSRRLSFSVSILMKSDWVSSLASRQWPKVYDLCHTFFARCASQNTHTAVRESQAKRVTFSHGSETRAILAWQCFFLLEQRAKTCDKI